LPEPGLVLFRRRSSRNFSSQGGQFIGRLQPLRLVLNEDGGKSAHQRRFEPAVGRRGGLIWILIGKIAFFVYIELVKGTKNQFMAWFKVHGFGVRG